MTKNRLVPKTTHSAYNQLTNYLNFPIIQSLGKIADHVNAHFKILTNLPIGLIVHPLFTYISLIIRSNLPLSTGTLPQIGQNNICDRARSGLPWQ